MFGGKNKQSQQKPNAVQMLQQLMGQHQALYQMEMQILNEVRGMKGSINVPDYSDDLNVIVNEVRNLQGLVKGVNADTKASNEGIGKLLQLLEKDIKPNIDSITGHIAGMQNDFEENLNTLAELINQLNQTPEQLGEALNTVLENFQNNLNEILEEGITGQLESIDTNVKTLQTNLDSLKGELKQSIEEPVEKIGVAVEELQALKESMPTEIEGKIEEIVNTKLQEFDNRISNMEGEIKDMKKMIEALYKLFYNK